MSIAAEIPSLRVNKGTLAALVVALAYGTSSIAFKEPAPTDVLMAGVIVAVPLLGQGRLGPMTAVNLALWLVLVALGLIAAPMSTAMESAIPHQIVTLCFLRLAQWQRQPSSLKTPSRAFNSS